MDEVLKKLGNPGLFHVVVCSMLAITWWSVALGNVSITFYTFTPELKCIVEGSEDLTQAINTSQPTNGLEQEMNRHKRSSSASIVVGGSIWNVSVSDDQCSYNLTNINSTVSHRKCSKWTYDKSEEPRLNTITTEWDLVCEDKYKASLSSTVFFVGVFCGALIFGFISDYFGRKKTLALCLYSQMPISLSIAFLPNFISFTVFRFILGVWLQGISTVAFVHCIEFFRQKYRGMVMVTFGMSWAMGQMLTSLMAFLLQDWRYMQMFASGLALTTLPYFWWIPDSPRWLLVKGKIDEIVDDFVDKAARMNRLDVDVVKSSCHRILDDAAQQQRLAVTVKQESFLTVVRTPVLLKRLVITCYLWCSASLAYYVFLINIRDLAGSRYTNFAIGACLEIVINFVIILVMAKFGRKKPLLVCCVIVAVLCIISGTVPKEVNGVNIQLVVTVFSLLGKMAMAAVMCLVFVFAAELFPTFARGGCMALCGCSLRIGGILAPQTLYLKSVVFASFPYLAIAGAILFAGLLTLFLPETFGMQMPNNLADAIELVPERSASREHELLPHKLDDSSNTVSEDSVELTRSETC